MFINTTPVSLAFIPVRPEVTCAGVPDRVRSIPVSSQPSAIAAIYLPTSGGADEILGKNPQNGESIDTWASAQM